MIGWQTFEHEAAMGILIRCPSLRGVAGQAPLA